MLRAALAQFIQEPKVDGSEVQVLMEMTLKNLSNEGRINHRDYLDRVDLLRELGHPVLISNYGEFHRLASYLFRFTKQPIGLVMGIPTLRELFEEKYYADLSGGILESFGRMFKNELRLYVYPYREPKSGSTITAGNLRIAPHLRHLYMYLVENHFIQGIRDVSEQSLDIFSRDVLRMLQSGEPGWESRVPARVAQLIKDRKLLGYTEPTGAAASPSP